MKQGLIGTERSSCLRGDSLDGAVTDTKSVKAAENRTFCRWVGLISDILGLRDELVQEI